MEKVIAALVTAAITVTIVALAVTVTAVCDGLVLCYLWHWFIVPLGVKSVGMLHCWGIALFLGFATRKFIHVSKDKDKPLKDILSDAFHNHITAPALMLIVGYVVHCLI